MAKPWEEIKNEYITTTIGQRALAEKYGISLPALNAHSTAGNWVQLRKEYMHAQLEAEESVIQETTVEIIPVGEGSFSIDLGPDAGDMKPRQRYQLYSAQVKKIPKIDKSNPIHVKNRIESYFDCCNRNDIPTSPPDLARWLKTSTDQLRRWRVGEYRKETHQPLIENAWTRMEADLVNRIQTGTISPPSGIFLLKNWFGYKDVQDIVVAPKTPLGDLQNPEELRKRIEGTVIIDDDGPETK